MTEMEMGLSRRDALRNMSDRLDVSELTSFVSFIIQSDQLGMSLVDTLLAQADQLRVERRHRAQEQAQKIPTKMLIPMAFLIFPALLAIILGPIVPSMVDLMSTMSR
jgi:tight adherence protein C